MPKMMRLDRYLTECGAGTRSEVKNLIKKGRVSVDGQPVKDNSIKLDAENAVVVLDGIQLCYEEFRYFMLNKPQGVVSATRDGLSSTVIELLEGENPKGLFPVGRLDKDTEGFLLITNDGQLGHELLSPKKHVDKKYIARVDRELSEEEMKIFAEGVDIGDEKPTMPAEIRRVDELLYEVILREGRYHQVKRMFEAFGSTVVYLKRVSMGALGLDESLAPGEYRRLTADELEALRR